MALLWSLIHIHAFRVAQFIPSYKNESKLSDYSAPVIIGRPLQLHASHDDATASDISVHLGNLTENVGRKFCSLQS